MKNIGLSKKFEFKTLVLIAIFVVICFSVYVRAEGIGYSNFQGDEINTVDFIYEMKNGVLSYLLEQKRGPIQYVINIINVSVFGYSNELLIRLPYLVFGVFALYFVYRLTSKIYDKNTGFIATLFMSINGLFIAFSRITQYQSLMYMLVPIGMIIFLRYQKSNRKRDLIISALVMTLAFLTHYDTLSTIPFFIMIFIKGSYLKMNFSETGFAANLAKNKSIIKNLLTNMIIFFSLFILPALIYYVPFYFNNAFSDTTSSYLGNRIFGGGLMPRTQITLKLLSMYIPKIHMYFLFTFGVIAMGFATQSIESIKVGYRVFKYNLLKKLYLVLVIIMFLGTWLSLYDLKPRASTVLVVASSVMLVVFITFIKKLNIYQSALIAWFLGTFSFYFFIMKDPRTHVYVSVLPLFLLSAGGVYRVYCYLKNKWLRMFFVTFVLLMSVWVSGVNYIIFVDRSPEYPWWDKNFLGWPIYRIGRVNHKKIEGVFGFNNYRGWEQVAKLYDQGCLVGDFKSNEKDSITYFYVKRHQVNLLKNFEYDSNTNNLVVVEGPHSWVYVGRNFPNYVLLKTIYSNNVPVSYVYGKSDIYKEKKLLCEN